MARSGTGDPVLPGSRRGNARSVWKVIEGVLVAVAMLSFYTAIGLAYYHTGREFPRQPVPEQGRVVPENFHGDWMYLTKGEAGFESACFWIAGVAAVAAIAIENYKDPYGRRKRFDR